MVKPDIIPGILSGNVILKNVLPEFAPRSRAASSKLSSIFTRTEYMGIIINGKTVASGDIKSVVGESNLEEVFFELYKKESGDYE